MSIVIRNINGIKGFCFYAKGVPYTYIYTKHAIEMLGLVNLEKGYKKLRINRFGEHFISVVEGKLPDGVEQSDCGVNISNLHYAISQDYSDLWTSGGPQKMTNRPTSKYDEIIPEYTLDRVIFAIANKLHNKTAEEFRLQLIWNIIPHFLQTATQDQIDQVPILNQTAQFMYDNTNYELVTQQSYYFAKQILEMHLDRLGKLMEIDKTNIGTTDNLFLLIMRNINEMLKADEELFTVDSCFNKFMRANAKYLGHGELSSINHLKDCVIFNGRLYILVMNFIINKIRDIEHLSIHELNTEHYEEVFQPINTMERPFGTYVPDDPSKKQVVRFLSMDERAGLY